jgi:NAD(P)-dependent dehydrogenase (short-subunit alcohol dehydrogenase family)
MAIQLTYPEGCALVAGGAGNVGAGVTRRLAEAGLPVTFTYVGNEARARSMEEELQGEGLRVWARRMDLCDPASIDAAIAFAQEKGGGRLHTVACTSGAPVPFENLADFDIATVEKFFNADGMAYYRLVHQTVPVLRAGGGGTITLCTTFALFRVLSYDGISPFSKGAVDAMVRQIAWEEAKHNIRCNAVPIGIVVGQPLEVVEAAMAMWPEPERAKAQAMFQHVKSLQRIVGTTNPNSAGDLFAFLASDQGKSLTGQSIALDHGATL